MSQFLDTLDAGCASLDTVARNRGVSSLVPEGRWEGESESGKIHQTIAHMIEHLTERMHVSTLAGLINVSPSYYFALFKRQTGYAPIDFLIHLRMRRACLLLETTASSVKVIADELGYDDAFYFSRLFKSVTSTAPTEYRLLERSIRESIADQLLPQGLPDDVGPRRQNGATASLKKNAGVRRA